jgi:hypothetical protein
MIAHVNTLPMILALLTASAEARQDNQMNARSCPVTRLTKPLEIDAKWDKAVWKNIRPERIGNYMGDKPDHLPKTDVKIAYDDAALYVIFRVEDQYVRAVTSEGRGLER